MTRTTEHPVGWTCVACALALAAAFGVSGGDAASPPPPASARAPSLSLIETLTLLRWGEGALDWTLPDVKEPKGEPDARTQSRGA